MRHINEGKFMTKREVMAKYGISMIRQDLDEKADAKFEKIVKNLADISETVDQDIEKFCSKCNYRGNDRRCDSILKGCSEGVDCIYIDKSKKKKHLRKRW